MFEPSVLDEKLKVEELVSRHFNLAREVRELHQTNKKNKQVYDEYTAATDRWIGLAFFLLIGQAAVIAYLLLQL